MTVLVPLVVTGGSGQLAAALARAGGDAVRVVGRPEFDFDRPETVADAVRAARPAIVINTAAYTAVDRAESEPEAAMRANRDGPALLAEYCAAAGIALIHVSTDYVFDGAKGAPYVETDPTHPTGIYGASKLAGEQAVLRAGGRAVILRTSWVYGPTGRNFVLTMLNAAKKTDRLRVVADQRGCPTATPDLARAILDVAAAVRGGWHDDWGGVYHASGGGETTWHGLAVATFEEAARHGLPCAEVAAIATADWPTPAKRPPDSRLDCGKLARTFGVRLPHWRESLSRVVDAVTA
jgi:dTDP-4-dehydrorhamnose reductase